MFRSEKFEQELSRLPLLSYLWIKSKELSFSERVREICRRECPMYNKTWSCPPAVGSVDACREKCLAYDDALVICTAGEASGDLAQTLRACGPHEAVTREIERKMRECGLQTMVLSAQACTQCEHCTWPDQPCRHAETVYPCMESHGILVTELAEKCGVSFYNENFVTWFSVLFYRS